MVSERNVIEPNKRHQKLIPSFVFNDVNNHKKPLILQKRLKFSQELSFY